MAKRFLAGSGEEAVDIRFLDAVIFIVEFALNRVKLAGAVSLGNQIDAGILFRDTVFFGDVVEQPNVAVKFLVSWFMP